MSKLDFMVVGSGLFGSVFANRCHESGKSCLVVERRGHVAGNCFTEKLHGIEIHRFGAHVLHTNSQAIWDYVRRFTEMLPYRYHVVAKAIGKHFSFPLNLATFERLEYGNNRLEVMKILKREVLKCHRTDFESVAESQIGSYLYRLFYQGYTQKMWGRDPKDLPCSLFQRIPIRYTYCDDYFDDEFQGVPKHGYTAMVQAMLEGVKVEHQIYDTRHDSNWRDYAHRLVYSGSLDELFGYCHGRLEYRTIDFQTEVLDIDDYQGIAAIHYPDLNVPYTRVVEHKYLMPRPVRNGKTIITKEVPGEATEGKERLYPVPTPQNLELQKRYEAMADSMGIIWGGRNGNFRYQNMDQTVAESLRKFELAVK